MAVLTCNHLYVQLANKSHTFKGNEGNREMILKQMRTQASSSLPAFDTTFLILPAYLTLHPKEQFLFFHYWSNYKHYDLNGDKKRS